MNKLILLQSSKEKKKIINIHIKIFLSVYMRFDKVLEKTYQLLKIKKKDLV